MKNLLKPSIVPAIIWAIFLGVLMLLPSDSFPESSLLTYDKAAHISVFLILTFLLGWASLRVKKQTSLSAKQLGYVYILSFFYGTSLELLQNYVPGRSTDIYDFIANSLGGVLGLAVFYIFTQKKFAKLKLML